ncbi:MAG: hypothetical protein RLZZ231_78, partial [Bacteroidota bacterium]
LLPSTKLSLGLIEVFEFKLLKMLHELIKTNRKPKTIIFFIIKWYLVNLELGL